MAEESCTIYSKNADVVGSAANPFTAGRRAAPGDVEREIPERAGHADRQDRLGDSGPRRRHPGSGLMSTAGGLIFYGDRPAAHLSRPTRRTGKLLWHFNTGQGWKAGPMTYTIAGTQHIGVAAGSTIMVFALP